MAGVDPNHAIRPGPARSPGVVSRSNRVPGPRAGVGSSGRIVAAGRPPRLGSKSPAWAMAFSERDAARAPFHPGRRPLRCGLRPGIPPAVSHAVMVADAFTPPKVIRGIPRARRAVSAPPVPFPFRPASPAPVERARGDSRFAGGDSRGIPRTRRAGSTPTVPRQWRPASPAPARADRPPPRKRYPVVGDGGFKARALRSRGMEDHDPGLRPARFPTAGFGRESCRKPSPRS